MTLKNRQAIEARRAEKRVLQLRILRVCIFILAIAMLPIMANFAKQAFSHHDGRMPGPPVTRG